MNVKKVDKVKKPKAGDEVSLKVLGYGLTSYESAIVERARLDKVWIDGRREPYTFPEGRGDACLGLRVDCVFDGGKAASDYEASGE